MKASKGAKMTALIGQSFGTFTIIVYYLNWLSNLRHQTFFFFLEKKLCSLLFVFRRGTSALHLNEATWIIDGSNELIVDFLFALVLFLDSTQPRPFKNPKQIFFFWIKQTNDM